MYKIECTNVLKVFVIFKAICIVSKYHVDQNNVYHICQFL